MAGHPTIQRWTIQNATELYGNENWGGGHFVIDSDGNLCVELHGEGGTKSVCLIDLISELQARGLDLPVLLRFGELLDERITVLNEQFAAAMSQAGYKGEYRGVYPIKVNQQQQVIEEIARFGSRYHHGFEAGSKAELMAALAYLDDPEAYVVCNGYKDYEFVDLALHGLRIGVRAILVVEMPGELELVLERARKLKIRPLIGVRIRPGTQVGGHWNGSSGERSVFGLNTAQLMDVVDRLREEKMLDCLQLLHYHLGSQIPNIRDIRNGLSEACRYYTGLVAEGAAMGLLDIGGGLAVDYDGSHTNFANSCNYSLEEYCSDVVEVVMTACEEAEIAHPFILSESGRATVAYYSILLFNILDVGRFRTHALPENLTEDTSELVQNLLDVGKALTAKNAQECFHDLLFYRDEVRSRFVHGTVSLRERAMAEQIFWNILARLGDVVGDSKYVPEELRNLDDVLTDIYYGNFSVFQSLPDAWAIDQLFPIMPIHRLNERPTRQAIISDITCDCDGKIDRFIDLHDVRRSLPLHELKDNESYVLGAFLVGAYQETLGDLHNLLGDTNVVSVRHNQDGHLEFTREIVGDTVADVLTYVEYSPKELVERMRRKAEKAVRNGSIDARQRRRVMDAYQAGLRGYTYYEDADA
jgi:arginine decarboxylase